jgi:uncharacterized protein (DUF488 family)
MSIRGPRPRPSAELYTVGHSNHSIERFLALLQGQGIAVLADVRSRPYSRFVPHFGRERLARVLEQEDVGYLFLGRELGGKPPKAKAHAPAMSYQARVAQPEFHEGIDRLLRCAEESRVALLCRERDPLDCHRFHLVCRYLRPLRLDIRHILPDGKIELQPATERRLLDRVAGPELPLLEAMTDPANERALAHAYDRWWSSLGR